MPVFSMRLGFADAGNRVETDTSRQAYDLLSEGFGPGFNGPILVVADHADGGAATRPTLQELASQLEATEGVASVTEPIKSSATASR